MSDRLWWKHGVVYQIYPRSFMDSNGDGVGDLAGIRARLDHLAWLGIDAIWLSPIFPSPMADFGYDVVGLLRRRPAASATLAEFDALLAEAHARGIRVMLDWVPNHTSDQHAWFRESRSSRASAKRDWYVWRDPRADGAPPNNWAAMFGGPRLAARRRDGPVLPALVPEGAARPELAQSRGRARDARRAALLARPRRRRLPHRRDPPHREGPGAARQPAERAARARLGRTAPRQHDENHPDIHGFLRRIRARARPVRRARGGRRGRPRARPGRDVLRPGRRARTSRSTSPSCSSRWDAGDVRARARALRRRRARRRAGPTSCSRTTTSRATRPAATTPSSAKRAPARWRCCCSRSRGTPFLYYGEELGMRNGAIPPERRQDPLALDARREGRRATASARPCSGAPQPGAGFTTGEPWLPLGGGLAHAATSRRSAPIADRSCWLYRDLLALRRRTPALEARNLSRGAQRQTGCSPGSAGTRSRARSSRVNFADVERTASFPPAAVARRPVDARGAALPSDASQLVLGPCEARGARRR